MTPTCGADDCQSPCHDPDSTGRYCAPTRCYCGGCPSHVPIVRGVAGAVRAQLRAQLPTLADARAERDEAMGRAAAGSDDTWNEAVRQAIAFLGASGQDFSTDDVWAWLESRDVPKPREPRALGPIMNRFVKLGTIEPVGFTPSVRRHAAPIRTYRGQAR